MKKLIAALLSLCLLTALTATPVFAAPVAGNYTNGSTSSIPQDDNDDDIPAPVDAKLYVVSYEKGTLKAGDNSSFPMTIGSRITNYTDSIRLSISGTGDYADKFSLQDKTGWYEIGRISGDTVVYPTLKVDSSVPDGRYKLTINFQYADIHGNYFTSIDTIMVTVYGQSSDTPYITKAAFTSAEIDKNNKSKLNVSLYNPMSASIWDVNAAFNAKSSEGFSLYENFQPVKLSSISAKQTGIAVYSMYVNTSVASGNYPMTFDISYKDAAGAVHTISQTIYVQVNRAPGAGDGKSSQPRIIVSKYSTDVEQIQAGKGFTLDFSLQKMCIRDSIMAGNQKGHPLIGKGADHPADFKGI